MGQRLNIEIHDHKSGGLQANAYYHWSGYSETAIELTKQIVEALDKVTDSSPKLRAIKLLEFTGAGLTDTEKVQAASVLEDYKPRACTGRNDGLIAISAEGMDNTRNWEEGRVELHLNTWKGNYIRYAVYSKYSLTEYKNDFEVEPNSLAKVDFDFEDVPLEKITELEALVSNNDEVRVETVICFIK